MLLRFFPLNRIHGSARLAVTAAILSLGVSMSVANESTEQPSDLAIAPLNDVLWVGLVGALIISPAPVDN